METIKTPQEIVQWVIDNRYPKSENDKVSDFEMYNILLDNISQFILLKEIKPAMGKYIKLISEIADLYSLDIRAKSKDFQKILLFDIKDELECYMSERRVIEASKQYKESKNV